MTRRREYAIVTAVVLLMSPSVALAPANADTHGADPRIRFLNRCPVELPTARRVDCGTFLVPELWGHPRSPRISVAFAIVRGREPVRSDPIVFLMGGPSYPAIDPFSMAAYFDHTAYTRHRDLILVDVRGTGSSTPLLNCPELDRMLERVWPESPTDAQGLRAERRCHDRMAETVNLRHYGSVDSARDVLALRRALGIRRWNVMAFSAGGEVGFQLLRLDPEGTRAIVLDAPVTGLAHPKVVWGYWPEPQSRLFTQMFDGCEAQASCAAAFPDLESRFWAKVEELDQNPQTVEIPVEGGGSLTVEITGHFFKQDVAGLVFFSPDVPFAPAILDDLLRHGIEPLYDVTIGPPFPFSEYFAEGRTFSYRCREFISQQDEEAVQAALDAFPGWESVVLESFDFEERRCAVWDVGEDPRVSRFVDSDVPALVFAGEWDGAVANPPIPAAASHLSNGTFLEIPGIDHGALASYGGWQACPRSIATDFLDHPASALDTSCVDEMPHIVFETSLPADAGVSSAVGAPSICTAAGACRWLVAPRWAQVR